LVLFFSPFLKPELPPMKTIPFTSLPGMESWPAFSPDGRQIAFEWKDDIYVQLIGGEPQRLTFDNQDILNLTRTPDGKEIIFDSNREGVPRIWRIATSGSAPEPLGAYGIHPAVSRQERLLAYASRFVTSDIWRIALSPAISKDVVPRRLMASRRYSGQMQISQDNTKIVFMSDRTGSPEIWRCDSSGLNLLRLTHYGGPLVGTPRWSPDSKFIAYDARLEGHSDIFIISAEGSTPRRLTTDSADDFVPSWSQDGQWIYFASNRSGQHQIWKMPVQGGGPVQVTKAGGYAAFESLDGNWVYFVKGARADGIWRVPVSGGEESPVIKAGLYWGAWGLAKDGIYFFKGINPFNEIGFYSFATGKVTTLTRLPKRLQYLAVSPDQRWLVYNQFESFEDDIMLVENFR
jgi:Tol biopolymer transport system component